MAPVTLNVAVFADGLELALVRLEAGDSENATASAAARGYSYAGFIAVNGEAVTVHTEPGFEAVMPYAGVVFAEMVG